MYNTNTPGEPPPLAPNRMSAYVFNPSAHLGAGADWQPVAGLIQPGQWYHIVGEYNDPNLTPYWLHQTPPAFRRYQYLGERSEVGARQLMRLRVA